MRLGWNSVRAAARTLLQSFSLLIKVPTSFGLAVGHFQGARKFFFLHVHLTLQLTQQEFYILLLLLLLLLLLRLNVTIPKMSFVVKILTQAERGE